MKIFSSLLLLIILVLSFLSCQKDSHAQSTPTNTDYITTSTWAYDTGGVDADRNGTIDLAVNTSNYTPCRLDNIVTFKKDNTGITDEGATKCSSTDPQTTSFNWSFADNETNLNISGNVFPLLNGKF